MTNVDHTPLTAIERRYLELLDQPSPYRNPKWHDHAYMGAQLGLTGKEVCQLECGLIRKQYLKWVIGGVLCARTRKPLIPEAESTL